MDQLSVALKRVEMLLARAEDNPLISRAFGIEHKRPKKIKHALPQSSERTKQIRNELDQLTIDQLRDVLSRDSNSRLMIYEKLHSLLAFEQTLV